jgi:hypothetical protein
LSDVDCQHVFSILFIVSPSHHKSSPTVRLLLTESFLLFDSNHLCRPPLILGAFAKLWKPTIGFVMSLCPSVCSHGTSRLPLNGFSWNLIFECFSKIYPENSSLIKLWQKWRVLYTKTNIRFSLYLTELFLEWEMFQTKLSEKIKTRFCVQ